MTDNVRTEPMVIRNDRGLSIAGTRITLYALMNEVTAGWPTAAIRETYPQLTDEQFDGAMAYTAEHRAEVEAEYRQIVARSEELRRYYEERNRERDRVPRGGVKTGWTSRATGCVS